MRQNLTFSARRKDDIHPYSRGLLFGLSKSLTEKEVG